MSLLLCVYALIFKNIYLTLFLCQELCVLWLWSPWPPELLYKAVVLAPAHFLVPVLGHHVTSVRLFIQGSRLMEFLMCTRHGPGPWGYGRSGHNPHPQESHPLVDQEMQRSRAGRCRGASGGVKAQRSCDQFLPRRWAVCQGLGQACVGCEERMGICQAHRMREQPWWFGQVLDT